MKNLLLQTFLITSFLFGSLLSKAQIYLDVDTYDPNNSLPKEYFTTEKLPNGETFELTISGTYSIWAPSYWSSPCGNYENAPQFPSPIGNSTGTVGFDAEYMFGLPTSSICRGKNLPSRSTKIQVSTDNGVTWFHPANTEPYNTSHTYHYTITGQGFPLGIRQNATHTSDDYGILKCEILQISASCSADLNFDTHNTTDDNLIEEIFDNDNLILGTSYDLTVDGTYSVWSAAYWNRRNHCGTPRSNPKYPSSSTQNGYVGLDFEYFFGSAVCPQNLPSQTSRIEISTDGGSTWFHPNPTVQAFDSSHQYSYQLIGEGYPIGVRHISPLNSDDYGVLKFSLITSSNCPLSITTGVEEIAKNESESALEVYPNPFRDILTIKNLKIDDLIRIYNMRGELIHTQRSDQPHQQITLSDLPKGIYFIRINEDSSKIRKVVKN